MKVIQVDAHGHLLEVAHLMSLQVRPLVGAIGTQIALKGLLAGVGALVVGELEAVREVAA